MAEQRYRAVLAVIGEGRTVTEVAAGVGVSRQTLHACWPSTKPAGWRAWGRVEPHWFSAVHAASGRASDGLPRFV